MVSSMRLRRHFDEAVPVIFAAVLGHLAMYLVPDSVRTWQTVNRERTTDGFTDALSLAQTALALLAIASLMIM